MRDDSSLAIAMGPPTVTWALELLPAVRAVRCTLRARVPARLANLPTTALHGALEQALAQEPAVLEALHGSRAGEPVAGITDRPPSGLVLAPGCPTSPRATLLDAGDTVAFTLSLIGPARRHEGAVVAAVYRAAEAGLGPARSRATFDVTSVEARDVPLEPGPAPAACEIAFESPLRIKDGGKITGEIDADALWRALVRRADLLARFHGGGPVLAGRAPAAPFSITSTALQKITVRRYSSRQQRFMAWPGLVGAARVEAGADAATFDVAWRLLAFAEAVQLGKATSFGFGKIRVGARARSGDS